MKRLFVIAVLIVGITGVMYAQDLRFDGYLNSGVGLVSTGIEDADLELKAFGVDSESDGYRFRLNGSYTNETKNAGARFRLQSQRVITNGYLNLPYAYGWVGFLDNMVTFTGGLVMDSTWETADWWIADDNGEGLGLLIKAEPIKGLNLGIGAFTISQNSGSSNNVLPTTSFNTRQTVEDAKYVFSAGYTMPDTFRLSLSYRTKNKAGYSGTDADTGDYNYSGNEESDQFFGEFRFLGMKGLTAIVVGKFTNLEDFSDNGRLTFSETFAYRLDSLTIGLNAVQFLRNHATVDYDPSLLFNLWGSYAINNILPRLDLVYFMNGQSLAGVGTYRWHRKAFTDMSSSGHWMVNGGNNRSVFSARPSVRINLDNRTFMEIGDMINYDFDKDGNYFAGDGSRLSNIFYVDFRLSF